MEAHNTQIIWKSENSTFFFKEKEGKIEENENKMGKGYTQNKKRVIEKSRRVKFKFGSRKGYSSPVFAFQKQNGSCNLKNSFHLSNKSYFFFHCSKENF